jgi:hypothetical protein
MAGVKADLYLVTWSLAWDVHILTTAPWRLFHGNIFHPSPFSLAYSEHFLGNVPLFALPYLLSRDPVLSLNLLVLLAYASCSVAMYALLRSWVGRASAALGALAFAFTGYRYAIVPPYVYLLSTFYLPLAALFFTRWLARRRSSDLVIFSLFVLLQMLASYYLAYATIVALLGFAMATISLPRARRITILDWSRCLLVLAGASVLFGALSLPYLDLRRIGIIPSYDGAVRQQGSTLSLVPYFAAQRLARWWGDAGPALPFLLLACLGLTSRWRAQRWPLVLAVYCCVAGVVLSFGRAIHLLGGEWWSPYGTLAAVIPGFSTIRQPLRFVALFEFGFAILVAFGSERVARWTGRGALIAVAVAGWWLLDASRLATHPLDFVKPDRSEAEPYEWLAAHGDGKALLELPRAADFTASARRMYLSTIHWLPTVDGYSGYAPRTDLFLHRIAGGLPSESALQDLVDYAEIGWIVLHGRDLSQESRERWRRWGDVSGLELVWSSKITSIFSVHRRVRDDRRDRLFSRTVTLDGTELVPLDGRCDGWLEVDAPPAAPVPPRSKVRFRVRVHNASSHTWPAHGFVPRHLVRLRRTLLRRDGPAVSFVYDDLPSDVAPGSSIAVPVDLRSPARPGAYRLRLELEQVMDRPLAECGVAPVDLDLLVAGRSPPASVDTDARAR